MPRFRLLAIALSILVAPAALAAPGFGGWRFGMSAEQVLEYVAPGAARLQY